MDKNQYNSDAEAIDAFVVRYNELTQEIGKVIVGQDEVIKKVLISIFSRGHCLLVGVPGLAKTLLVSTISNSLGLSFNRIQFTPDLMPSDIIGSEILDEGKNFKFVKGPLFANIILADEINRTPPKTQAALLEAMQERTVTAAGHQYQLDLKLKDVLHLESNKYTPLAYSASGIDGPKLISVHHNKKRDHLD